MKKLIVMWSILFILLVGCGTPVGDGPPTRDGDPTVGDSIVEDPVVEDPVVTLTPFEAAVLEVYKIVGATLFYSTNGRTKDNYIENRVVGPNEIPGVCTDYAIEFAYHWNEVKDYDRIFGKAYLARVPYDGRDFKIQDFIFVPNGTSKIREESGDFGINGNDQESDGVYRDVIYTSVMYSGRRISHFGQYVVGHKWVVIYHEGAWYDTDPTWWEFYDNEDFLPTKIIF